MAQNIKEDKNLYKNLGPVIYIDIFGNEKLEVKTLKDFNSKLAKR
ncbi:MAG: hypothetical protein WA240_05050 [Nitrospirota bacterium]